MSDFKVESVESIADDLIGAMPEVSEHVIDLENQQAPVNNPVDDVDKSNPGEFDPEIHSTDKDGNPIINKDGTYRRKPGKKKGGASSNGPHKSTLNVDNPQGATATNTAEIGPQAAAKAATHLIFTMGHVLGGDEWQPIVNEELGINEPAQIEGAFKGYFDAKGIDDFPPGVALTIALAFYALPRFQRPKTRTRLSFLWMKCKGIFRRKNKGLAALKTEDEKESK